MMKYIYIACLACLMGCTSGASEQKSKPIRTYKVILNNGKEYIVKSSGYCTFYKYDSKNPVTIFNGGCGSFFNVSVVVEVYE